MSILLSLLGGGLGGVLRFVPEIIKMFNAKGDREHEFRMSELQLKIDQARSAQDIDKIHAGSDASQLAGDMQSYIEAIKGQSQITGVKWIDALSSSVRPVLTYWWMLLFTFYKSTAIYYFWTTAVSVKEALPLIWDAYDWGMFSMMLGFWFCDRAIKRSK